MRTSVQIARKRKEQKQVRLLPKIPYFCNPFYAGVAKLADALDLGSSGAIHVGSIPITRTLLINFGKLWLQLTEKILVY